MAGAPIRYPSGVTTFKPQDVFGNFPFVPNPIQAQFVDYFSPFVSGYYTVTQTNGALATYPFTTGAIQATTTGSTAADKISVCLNNNSAQFMATNKLWSRLSFAVPATISDTNVYSGVSDTADITAASNGVYFLKPAGGTTVNLVVKKAGTTTTFTNIADMAKPSGIYNDATSVVGTLNTTQSGGLYNAISVATPGSGYAQAPLVLLNGASGSGATATCAIGSGGLYSPVITAQGASYSTATSAVLPFITFALYFDGDTIYVGVNGNKIMSIGSKGAIPVTPGATVANASFNSYSCATQVSTSLMPIQPAVGSFMHMAPLTALYAASSMANTTANARNAYISGLWLAGEEN